MARLHIPNAAKTIEHGARALVVLGLAGLLLCPQVSRTAETAAGDLDSAFGMGGKVRTDFFGGRDTAAAIVIQTNDRIVLGGTVVIDPSNIESTEFFGFARYQPDGSLDPTFGLGGKTTFGAFGFGGESGRLKDVAIQPDGKIVASGLVGITPIVQGDGDAVVTRHNANGSADQSFGSRGAFRMAFRGTFTEANAVAIQPDGRIVFGGADVNRSRQPITARALGRLNAGTLDPSFGLGGKVILNTSGRILRMALQPDGKIVLVGDTTPLVQRLNSNGSLDASFGSGGAAADPGPGFFLFFAVALQTDGKIVCVGRAHNPPDIALIRYNANGTLDPSFGSGGIVTTDFGNSESAFAVAIQSNGKIVIAGSNNQAFMVLRYESNGSLDPTFNQAPTNFGCTIPFSEATGVVIQPDGKIVAGGSACSSASSDFVLARYTGDGPASDFCVQDDINGSILRFNSNTGAYQFINCGKAASLAGTGQITRNGCKIELQASGPDPKRPDRSVTASVNTCTQQGSASIKILASGMMFWNSGQRHSQQHMRLPMKPYDFGF